jgi:OOP family OmpA-OmpF porin
MAAGDAPSTYIPAPEVRSDMAQVVFFRRAGPPEAGPAHVYIDGAFHTALQPRDFVRLCLPEGIHSIEAYVGDAPAYAGKAAPTTRVRLAGGKSYFVAVADPAMGEAVPFRRADAEALLEGAPEQRQFPSRASGVIACEVPAAAQG